MKTSNTYSTTMDDIIFEQRNTSYGAYMLRKKYPQRVYTSLLITISVFALVVAVPEIMRYFVGPEGITKNEREIETVVSLTEKPDIIMEIQKTEPSAPQPPKTASSAAIIPKVTDKPDQDTTQMAINDVIPATSSTANGQSSGTMGTDLGNGPAIASTGGNGSSLGTEKVDSIAPYADELPSFPSLAKFLQKNLRYPSQAVESGIQGLVYVSFVVSKDGSLRDFNIVKGISKDCNDEALRVVRKMPNWKPGKFRGQPVSVRYNLPIKYVLGN